VCNLWISSVLLLVNVQHRILGNDVCGLKVLCASLCLNFNCVFNLYVLVTHNARPGTFVHKDLLTCTHVCLRQDSIRNALDPPYTGPYPVLSGRKNTLCILVRGKPHTVSTDRVKPAYIFSETDDPPTTSNPAVPPSISTSPPPLRTTRQKLRKAIFSND
jgi:hypothetical protein